MMEQGDAATLAANGPATLGAMAEAEANEEEEEKPFMELSVAGSGRTGQGACVICDGGLVEDGALGSRSDLSPLPSAPTYLISHPSDSPTTHTIRRAGPAAGDRRGPALHHGAR